MLSVELARLRDTFEAWSRGDPFPTAEAWYQFQRDLRELTGRLALQEAGIELSVIDVLVQSAKPGSNVHFLPVERLKRGGDGSAS
jgi:hypothetical protein